MNSPAVVTKDARRATRIVLGGAADLRNRKPIAHRINRRKAKAALGACDDFDV